MNFGEENKKYNNFGEYHPSVVMFYFTVVLGVTMTVTSPDLLVISLICGLIYSTMLRGLKGLKNNLILMVVVVTFTTAINTLFTHDGETVLFYLHVNRVTLEALIYGIFSGVVISTVIIWFSCINVIVSGEMVMYIFSKISPRVGLMISMTLRYIPLFKYRFDEISMVQKAMGKESQGGLIAKGKLFIKKISILISWSLEGSIETADAMAARGYGIKGRNSFILYKFSWRDRIGALVILVTTTIMIYLMIDISEKMYFYPKLIIPEFTIESLIRNILFGTLALMPIIIDVIGDIRWKKLELSS